MRLLAAAAALAILITAGPAGFEPLAGEAHAQTRGARRGGDGGQRARPWAKRKTETAWGTRNDIYGGYSTAGLRGKRADGPRLRTLTSAQSDARSSQLTVHGEQGKLRLDLHRQVELERRLSLPRLRRSAGDLPAGMRWKSPRHRVRTHRDLVSNLLDRFVTDGANPGHQRIDDSRIFVAPLSSRYQHAHRPQHEDNGYVGPIAEDPELAARFTQEIVGQPMYLQRPGSGESWATIQRNYIVGIQHESATYYDTPDGAARERGLALREKRWHPLNDDGRVEAPTGRGLFAKRTLRQRDVRSMGFDPDDFTARDEAFAELPVNTTRRTVLEAVRALALQEGMTKAEAKALKPVRRVENQRASVDLVYRVGDQAFAAESYQKIGFLVVDSYRTVNLKTGKRGKEQIQFEIELLPEGRAFYQQSPAEFRRFFAEIERAYGATIDLDPKYLH